MNKKILVLTGPTGSGKTKAAITLAKKTNAAIICADSRIVYKDFDIVSAKPTLAEREGVEHYLIDIINPDLEFSAGDFVSRARKITDELFSQNKNVIISGGTWFYIKSLLGEYSLIQSSKNEKLRRELEEYSSSKLWEKLNKLDPVRASKVHPNNKDKIIRSLEMIEELKAPVSSAKLEKNDRYSSIWFMPELTREELYSRINKRVDEMIEKGLIEEFEKNIKKYPSSTVLKNTIGYREFIEFEDKASAIEKIKQHTRNFAKRQLTYFKSNKNIKSVSLENGIDEIAGIWNV